ncbi:hypothetical protein [Teredinibacter sp. KSP-S5-2]|uniref:DUF3885 domain-containing protein n=1 Tax=Teredinibacter sp. KSP-S5-2 TaxID=3034506 RepID=UPI00293514AE|nr:hypothetical protein [Teredinibacter sp. KSP-S5-2]WNO10068.1 hypothetical protein P5V12_02670 [Teredinibacter sp. KSP-S5-2]
MIKSLAKFWEKEFEGFIPKAHNLKHEYKNRWVRFHSLPESKRYPETEDEYVEILRRHNLILQEIVGDKEDLYVILPEYSESGVPTKPEENLTNLVPISEYWCSIQPFKDEDYDVFWHLHASKIVFTGSELNDLFRLVANDEVRNIMIVCSSTKVVFHPYDGGADVVLASTKERDELKKKHCDWLSTHPEGF